MFQAWNPHEHGTPPRMTPGDTQGALYEAPAISYAGGQACQTYSCNVCALATAWPDAYAWVRSYGQAVYVSCDTFDSSFLYLA